MNVKKLDTSCMQETLGLILENSLSLIVAEMNQKDETQVWPT